MSKPRIVDSIAILDDCVREAGLQGVKDVSFEHFANLIKSMTTNAENYYYEGKPVDVELFLNEVIKIANAARVFNQHFGL